MVDINAEWHYSLKCLLGQLQGRYRDALCLVSSERQELPENIHAGILLSLKYRTSESGIVCCLLIR